MAQSDQPVTQPLIDRLIDRDRDRDYTPLADPYRSRSASVRQLKAALRRDLEWLLNTRRIPFPAPDSMPELAQSLYNYGLPDFSTLSIKAPKDKTRLLAELEKIVAFFEPRLKNVKVTLLDVAGLAPRTLRFQIAGALQMDPSPEQVSFDAELQLTSGEYQIRGERGA